MEEYKYKEDIVQSRTGNVGSSDSRMLQQIAELGGVPKSAMKRMAIIKGFVENPNITNAAMRYGDFVENQVYDSLKATDSRWQSNPCLVSEKYSRQNCGAIDHIDFMLQDDEHKVLVLCECKGTRYSFDKTREDYKWQLAHHWLFGKELAKKLGNYKLRLLLAHYNTEGVDLDAPFEFDPSRLTVKPLRNMDRYAQAYRLSEAMDIVNDFLPTFDEYFDEEIDGQYLPEQVRSEFDMVTSFITEIKEREAKIDEFKKKLCNFMQEKGIKAIKTDGWGITLVEPSEAVSVDYKAVFANEIEAKAPRIAKRLREQYKKTTKKGAYVMIKMKNNNNN